MTYNQQEYVTAWGSNKPLIVGGINDEFSLPKLPVGHDWLLTREVTKGKDSVFATYRLALIQHLDEELEVLTYGHIDKVMYGEDGVRQLARRMKEKYVHF